MSNEQQTAPSVFYKIGDIHPIKMTFWCEYPYPTPGIYAVYLNEQSKQHERVHLPTLQSFQTDYARVYNRILTSARHRLKMIVEAMTAAQIEIPDEPVEQ
jgi:hypothetical protein